MGESEEGSLAPGDTVEIHFVHTSANTKPGATLGACFTDTTKNRPLRRFQTGMTCYDLIVITDQHGRVETIALDRAGNLLDLLLGVDPGIGLVGLRTSRMRGLADILEKRLN